MSFFGKIGARRAGGLVGALLALPKDKRGNVATFVAICTIPMLFAIGASLDTLRAYNVRAKMQADLDASLIAAVKTLGTKDTDAVKQKVSDWFNGQQASPDGAYGLDSVSVDLQGQTISASASGTVQSTLLSLAGVSTIPISVSSSVAGPTNSYMNVYFVIDKSASMMLAATEEGQALMQENLGCVFACHELEGGPESIYDESKALGVTLRSDVAVEAVKKAMSVVDAADPAHEHIKVGLYKIGDTATEVLAPTFSTSNALSRLTDDSYGLTSATSIPVSYFDAALARLETLVGAAGDGSTAGKPKKLVLMLTDGVQSNRFWVSTDSIGSKVAPLNPDWCETMKKNGATIGILYTEYLPMPWDWGYEATVGNTMEAAQWKMNWGGDMRPGVSSLTTRQAYLPYALTDCASSSDLFISAGSSTEIEKGLKTLLRQYMTATRVTH